MNDHVDNMAIAQVETCGETSWWLWGRATQPVSSPTFQGNSDTLWVDHSGLVPSVPLAVSYDVQPNVQAEQPSPQGGCQP